MSYYGSHEILADPATPIHYGIDDGQEGYSEEDYDPYTSANVIGSNPELGGEVAETATFDLYGIPINDTTESSIVGSNTVNLTGMSESPMTPDTENGANINGAGSAGQQVFTRNHANSWISQTLESLGRGISRQGVSATTVSQAGAAQGPSGTSPATPPVLTQTGVAGISLSANLVMFFIVGAIIAAIAFD